MTLVASQAVAWALMVLGLLLLGSWQNGYKLSGWRFELFYLDFAIGAAVAGVVLALTFGTYGYDSFTFMDDMLHAGKRNMAYALAAGMVFNLGWMLLVAAMSMLGMALSYLAGASVALGGWALVEHLGGGKGATVMVAAGVASMLGATGFSLATHQAFSLKKEQDRIKAGAHRTLRPTVRWKGMVLALAGGALIPASMPLIEHARAGEIGVGPYSLGFLMAAGILFSTVIYELYFMNLPVRGEPLEPLAYVRGSWKQHLWGLLAGAACWVGMTALFVLRSSPPEAIPDPSLLYLAERGFPIIAGIWGVALWKEFTKADARSVAYLVSAFCLMLAGLIVLALAVPTTA